MPKNLRLLGNTRGSQKIISTNEPTDAEHQKINKLRIKISKAKERALMKEFGLDENTLTEEDFAKRRVSLKTLIKLGLTRGYLSKVDICENLPSKLIDTEAFDVICTMFNDIGVAVYEDFVELKRSQKISKVNLRSDPLEAAMQAGLQDVVMDIIDGLPMHEAEVQRKRFGFEITTSRTLIGMGNQFEVTRERIRQIESKSLAKIKGPKGDF